MAAVDDPKSLGRSRLPFASSADIDEFVEHLGRFERGEMEPQEWRSFRLVRGAYGQRQADDAQMLRVKIPQGVLAASQLDALAEVAERWSRGYGHITTRQNLQFHFMKLHDLELAMRRLAEEGLTTREACGNSVRNITGCPYAGVAADEAFDVTPYAEALTRYLLRHPLSSTLPRKFKIGFEGCPDDHALTAINDIGFRARLGGAERERRGFRVAVGGGTAILCRSGTVLFEFLPAGEILAAAEAVLRVFHELGDYQHRQRNRMKFLIQQIGWDAFKEQVEARFAEVTAEGVPPLPFDPEHSPVEEAPPRAAREAPDVRAVAERVAAGRVSGPGLVPQVAPVLESNRPRYLHWRRTNVRAQKQPGYSIAVVTVVLGDLTSAQLRTLGELALAYGDGTVRVTSDQDLVLRWVRSEDLSELYRRLAAAGLGLPDAGTLADVTSCPGAETCRLAVTQSRGLGRLLGDFLRSRPDLVALAPGLDVKISGCPNGCGQHHVAGIGFQGSVRRLGDKVIPQYFVMVGGGVGPEGAKFGRLAAKVPARRLPDALERLLMLYRDQRKKGEPPRAFFQRVEPAAVGQALADLAAIGVDDASQEDFVDLGETDQFKTEVMDGECSA